METTIDRINQIKDNRWTLALCFRWGIQRVLGTTEMVPEVLENESHKKNDYYNNNVIWIILLK
jgi:hypothetical protein